MDIKELNLESFLLALKWRNTQLPMLRTAFPLTEEQQEEFYYSKICDRNSNCRFWRVERKGQCFAVIGIENIQWENRLGELSIITDPKKVEILPELIDILIDKAFKTLNLKSVFTEVYSCSPLSQIWADYTNLYGGYISELPYRKFYDGRYFNSLIYTYIHTFEPEVGDENFITEPSSTLN